jgi:DcaP outer membrane protein
MKIKLFLFTLALLFGLSTWAAAETVDDLKKQLDEAKQAIKTLESRLQALEAAQAKPAAPTPVTAAAVPAEKEKPKGSFEVYGFAQADAIQDFKRVDPNWQDTLRPSKIPTQQGQFGQDGGTFFSAKQSRFGVKSEYPTTLGLFKTKFEIDLFGVGGDAGQTTIRLRHAYGELGPVLAGQTNSLFMDIDVFPNTIDYLGPNGMVFYRNVQVRWTPFSGNTNFAIALERPGTDVALGADPYGTNPTTGTIQAYNNLPDLTAQLRHQGKWGHVQLAGILRRLGFETVGNPDSNPKGDTTGWGLNLSTNIYTFGKDKILAQVVYGEGIANYMNDGGGSDIVVTNGQATAQKLVGILAYYDHYWNDKWSSSLGYSRTQVDNISGQSDGSFKLGQYGSVNLLWYPWKSTMFGVEYLYGQREDKNGQSGEDHRIQFSFKYSFGKVFDL